jgi:hypothetical protein
MLLILTNENASDYPQLLEVNSKNDIDDPDSRPRTTVSCPQLIQLILKPAFSDFKLKIRQSLNEKLKSVVLLFQI